MTIEQKMTEMLVNHGLFPHHATEVMVLSKKSAAGKVIGPRWSDDIEGYPAALLTAIWMDVSRCAKEWATVHMPKAWWINAI